MLAKIRRDDSDEHNDHDDDQGLKERDRAISTAAEIAEALAVTTYINLIRKRRFIDQAVAALLLFVDKDAAAANGFNINRFFQFERFPVPPSPFGQFSGFIDRLAMEICLVTKLADL